MGSAKLEAMLKDAKTIKILRQGFPIFAASSIVIEDWKETSARIACDVDAFYKPPGALRWK